MKKSELAKEKIISVTTNLIQDVGGDIEKITIRLIAEHASVGVGLINHYFETKNQLIEICVQRIIENVILSFTPKINQESDPINRLKVVAKLVVDFLIENPEVSRISILGDMNSPKITDNTMKTVRGFLFSLEDYNISEDEKRILLFCLTSIIQEAFLRKEISKQSFGFDFNKKEERDEFIDFIIDRLFERTDKHENINN